MEKWLIRLGRRKLRLVCNFVQYLIGTGVSSFFVGICIGAIRRSIENGYENYGNVIAVTMVIFALSSCLMAAIIVSSDRVSREYVNSLYNYVTKREYNLAMAKKNRGTNNTNHR